MRDPGHKGFTLVELSMVLVVISLLIGGILVGQDLIRAATIRSEVSTMEKIQSAINTFRGKYNCVPGDCVNAVDFGLGPNGNGDGVVQLYDVPSSSAESMYFWTHLSAGNLIPGRFAGTLNDARGFTFSTIDGPTSKINTQDMLLLADIADILHYIITTPIYGNPLTSSYYNHALVWIQMVPNTGSTFAQINVREAFGVDSKIDDGIADTGRFLTTNDSWGPTNCVTGDYFTTDGSVNYNLRDTVNDCFPIWLIPN